MDSDPSWGASSPARAPAAPRAARRGRVRTRLRRLVIEWLKRLVIEWLQRREHARRQGARDTHLPPRPRGPAVNSTATVRPEVLGRCGALAAARRSKA